MGSRGRVYGAVGFVAIALVTGCASQVPAARTSTTPSGSRTQPSASRTQESNSVNGPIAYLEGYGSEGYEWSNWYVVNPDSTDAHQIPAGAPTDQIGPDIHSPIWSPDGTKVAYIVYSDGTATPNSVFVADAHGAHAVRINQGPPGGLLAIAWSADSRSVYEQVNSGGEISILHLDGSAGGHVPCAGCTGMWLVAAAPNGSFAFIYQAPYTQNVGWPSEQICILDPGTSTPRLLGPGKAAAFSPDGSKLAVIDLSGLWIENPDGSDRVKLPTGTDVPSLDPWTGIVWSPDGRWLAYATSANQALDELWIRPIDPAGKPVFVTRALRGFLGPTSWHRGPLKP